MTIFNASPPPDPAAEDLQALNVADIITRCNDAMAKMSRTNPNRYLLYLCASALRQLTDRLAEYEDNKRIH